MKQKQSDTNIFSENDIKEIVDRNDKNERIYHYTTLEAFYKIVDGINDDVFTFRAGSVYTMNDTQEMVLGYNKIMEFLPKIEQTLKVKKEDRITEITNNQRNNKHIQEKFGEWLINDDNTNFVVSFSSTADILPMWALYGGMGTGVCLEFSPYEIKKYYEKVCNEKHLRIEHCKYNENDIQAYLLDELEIVYRLFLKSNNADERKDSLVKAKYLATMCGITGAYVKHIGFEYEREIRMNIFRNKNEWKFVETRNGYRSAFVEVAIPLNALTNIIVGPAADMGKVKNAMTMTLRKKGITIEPKHSGLPYRIY